MQIKTHGIHIELMQVDDSAYVEFKLIGKLTHEDYETFVPFIESAVRNLPPKRLNILIDMTHFEGWTLEAAWDDFRFGLELRKDINKMAVVGDKTWEALFAKMADWLIAGKAKFFHSAEEARTWLMQS
ncbi:SpoIIAA family protein [Hydrogenimonas cancrithermarum]|uniref:STAS/SEC14 domain-containing protein n=1 Tax=Hydrogenimonas cancrithermarum TaxID=2993563 RepID=A0ABN6WVF3_9BACT|nr:STAS/SEC14 domain-containing protein [Hydrogenimonas cancrithermarum]BDY12869.1 STAS/SEC14 domain-containing protein [Hydrogenimonas cancrithermarum]BDY12986.1 STAS/SEC14 domain-containing protein [Hydrogenimonas cancrithermarum]